MTPPISSEIVEAHAHCPRKAFLLLHAGQKAASHEYQQIMDEQETAAREAHRARLAATGAVAARGPEDLAGGPKVLLDVGLNADGLEARCDALRKVRGDSVFGGFAYEPVKAVGVERIGKPQAVALAYLGHVLGLVQKRLPEAGILVWPDGRQTKVKLAGKYKEVRRIVEALKNGAGEAEADAPPVVLNKHCPTCPFRDACRRQAEEEDSLSLLDRMTPKLMRKYHDKGIFTVRQLSHIYKPRRSRRKGKRPVRHSLELQALAIRTAKTYVEHLPELTRRPVELFVDVEGVPDRQSFYLIGLLACAGDQAEYHAFWADEPGDEARLWDDFLARAASYPEAPLYHYGSYERKAFKALARRHGRGKELLDRLVNVAASVYGKVYFPVRSNGLKVLGRFLGAAWTCPEASGLQSLVWRHRWEATGSEEHRQALLRYNREDCEAVRLLVGRLDRIRREAASDPSIEFAGKPKRHATETGKAVHGQLERILQSAQLAFAGRGIRIRKTGTEEAPKSQERRRGHQHFHRIAPKVNCTVLVEPRQRCPKDDTDLVPDPKRPVKRTAIDLVFTRSGCRKTVRKYVSTKSCCPKCGEHYSPDSFRGPHSHAFGHTFQAWAVYQRIILRLPYRIIVQVTEHLFGVGMSVMTAINFLRYLADYYAPTEGLLLQAILKSDFVHVDETKINIQGVDHYVWVFTDGQHVVFRMTETRDADIVREVLAGYEGVLVSDFYPGYDGVPCRQQKCWVHLIRDINDDLWAAPFDHELEAFALAVQSLLVPILEAVDRYGLKAWHLRKFEKDVERFYARHVVGRDYSSELAAKYQKRFERYRGSLFTFLTQDGIPWENNMAERAIRQLAVQRKISGSFFKRVAPQYLLLLAISQTCRFQGKSFLKFLLSKEKDVDAFRRTKPIRYSAPVGRSGGGDKGLPEETEDGMACEQEETGPEQAS
jgi:predicted RecB family nuclease